MFLVGVETRKGALGTLGLDGSEIVGDSYLGLSGFADFHRECLVFDPVSYLKELVKGSPYSVSGVEEGLLGPTAHWPSLNLLAGFSPHQEICVVDFPTRRVNASPLWRVIVA